MECIAYLQKQAVLASFFPQTEKLEKTERKKIGVEKTGKN